MGKGIASPEEKDLELLLKKYPSLEHFKGKLGLMSLEGKLPVEGKDGEVIIVDYYDVRIDFLSNFPYFQYPKVYELSGRIKIDADWHVNVMDKSLCLAAPSDMHEHCKNGISALRFFKETLMPLLAAQYIKEISPSDKYICGERSHGHIGEVESLQDILSLNSREKVVEILERVVMRKNISKNTKCFCGSDRTYKGCHYQNVERVKSLGIEHLKAQLKNIKFELKL